MDRINHVKIVTPDPEAVDRFLREVVDIPEGWSLGASGDVPSQPAAGPFPARDAEGRFTTASVSAFRGTTSMTRGRIAGSTESRQFQILQANEPRIWAVAIGTRHLERAHQRCLERQIPCTDLTVTTWGDGAIRFFFAEAGGIVFEIMRSEPA